MNRITAIEIIADPSIVSDSTLYEMHYVTNLRTGMHQCAGFAEGPQVRQMATTTPAPRRLFFVPLGPDR